MIKDEWLIADSKRRPGRKVPSPLLIGLVFLGLFLVNVLGFLYMSWESEHKKYYELGLESFKASDFKQAEADFTKDIHSNPEHSLAHYYLGRTELNLNEHGAAVREFDLAYQTEMRSSHPDVGFAYKCKNYRDQSQLK